MNCGLHSKAEGHLIMLGSTIPVFLTATLMLCAQETKPAPEANSAAETKPVGKVFQVDQGRRIPLSLINSVRTKQSAPGDRVCLKTAFPILVDGRIVTPPGSYVTGTITEVKRPGKVKGRGEFHLRFDSLTLPNGVTRSEEHTSELQSRFGISYAA